MITLLILSSLLSSERFFAVKNQATTELAIIKGQVETVGKIRLPADVVLNCSGSITKVEADNDGKFIAHVQPGLCEVEAARNFIKSYKRAPFRVTAGKVNSIKVKLYYPWRLIVNYMDEKSGEMRDEGIPAKPKYDEQIELPESKKSGLYVRIIYEGKKHNKSKIIYQEAVFSFDRLMVHADQVIYNIKDKKFTFYGDCVIDEEELELTVKRASFDTKNKILSYK